MTQKEFEDRTSVKVPYLEYQAIEKVYMESDLDKDEFCRLWCTMNKTRVKKAKEEAKAKEEERKLKDKLIEIMYSLDFKMKELRGDFTKAPLTVSFLSEKQQLLLEKVGINLRMSLEDAIKFNYLAPIHFRIDDTSYAIKKYLKII